jgi:hypothetical protein
MAAPITNQALEEDLLSWETGSRPFKRRDRDTYVTIIAIASLFGIILFVVQGILPVILIASLVFLFYVLSTVEPNKVTYRITTLGVRLGDNLTPWENINRFWFTQRLNHHLLVLETASLLGRLEVVINEQDQDKIKKVMEQYISHEKSSPSVFDKTTKLMGKIIR